MRRTRWARGAVAVALVAVLTGGSAVAWPRGAVSQQEVNRRVAAVAERLAQEDTFSGSILLAKDGVPVLSQGYGMANRETQTPNDVDTVYNLASVGKMFTAVAIGQLVSQGGIAVDDPIGRYLPDYPAEVAAQVTVGDLLSHRSGIPDFFFAEREEYLRVVASSRPHRDYIQLFAEEPLEFEPGTRFEYSNSNFLLLGAIIEAVTGQDYYEYVDENVLEPAGMDSTYWSVDDVETGRLAARYTEYGEDFRPERGRRRLVDPMRVGPLQVPEARSGGHGGGLSTAEDLLKFLRALREGTLLDGQHLDLLLAGPRGDASTDYAYGFDSRSAPWWRTLPGSSTARAVGHSGGAQGVLDHAYMYPNGYDVVVLSNYESGAEELMAAEIDDLLLR